MPSCVLSGLVLSGHCHPEVNTVHTICRQISALFSPKVLRPKGRPWHIVKIQYAIYCCIKTAKLFSKHAVPELFRNIILHWVRCEWEQGLIFSEICTQSQDLVTLPNHCRYSGVNDSSNMTGEAHTGKGYLTWGKKQDCDFFIWILNCYLLIFIAMGGVQP